MKLSLTACLLVAVPALACSLPGSEDTDSHGDALRGLSKEEALTDLADVGSLIRGFYGPLEYKRSRFGFDIDRSLAEAKAEIEAGENEADRVRPIFKLLASLKDGHVSLAFPTRSDDSFDFGLPFSVTPLEGKYVVARLTGDMKRGDVLLSIDGRTTAELEQELLPYFGSGTLAATRHTVGARMTSRPFYVPRSLAPAAGASAHVVLQRADGTEYSLDIPWTFRKGLAGQVLPPRPAPTAALPGTDLAFSVQAASIIAETSDPNATVFEMGAVNPFYLTPEVRTALGVVDVAPKPETLAGMGVVMPTDPAAAASFLNVRGFKLKRAGKTILIVRIPSFSVPNNAYAQSVAWVAALLKDNTPGPDAPAPTSLADTPADVVVADVAHNPGGSVPYVSGLARLFISTPVPNFVQAVHADRAWIGSWLGQANAADTTTQPTLISRMKAVEAAFDSGQWLGPFAPLAGNVQGPTAPASVESTIGAELITPYALVHWEKPVLVLHDNLSGSGGDAFPMIMQNGGAKTFGSQTMGLGGSVQAVGTLRHSGATLSLTRGLFGAHNPNAAAPASLIENNGVTPDFAYDPTVADFRAGYVGFATSFADLAARLTRTGAVTSVQ